MKSECETQDGKVIHAGDVVYCRFGDAHRGKFRIRVLVVDSIARKYVHCATTTGRRIIVKRLPSQLYSQFSAAKNIKAEVSDAIN